MNIGGTSRQAALKTLNNVTERANPITVEEHRSRIERAQEFMRCHGIGALYLIAGSNLTYFSGTRWSPSERMVGALLPADGELVYIAPAFEESTIRQFMVVEGDASCLSARYAQLVLSGGAADPGRFRAVAIRVIRGRRNAFGVDLADVVQSKPGS